jgi:tetratricopeptide (TPR) repeat protein
MSPVSSLLMIAIVGCAHAPHAATPPASTPPPTAPESAPTSKTGRCDPAATTPLTDRKLSYRSEEAQRASRPAFERYQANDFDGAAKALRPVVDRFPDEMLLRAALAEVLARDGKVDEATQLIDDGPPHPALLQFEAILLLQQADDGPGVTRRQHSISYTASAGIDKASYRRSKREQARDALRRALEVQPDSLVGHRNLARTLEALEDWRGALSCRERIFRSTGNAEDHAALAAALRSVGRRDEALHIYESLASSQLSVAGQLAEIYDEMGRKAEAMTARRRARLQAFAGPVAPMLAPSDENLDMAEKLGSWFENKSGARRDDTAVSALIESLGKKGGVDAAALLAAFVWHHPHDSLESRAFALLATLGPPGADAAVAIWKKAQSTCTMRGAGALLARAHDPRAFALLSKALPDDSRDFFPIDVAGALDVLGDVRAVPLLEKVIEQPPPAGDDMMARGGYAMARERAILALGAFDSPETRSFLAGLAAGDEEKVPAMVALFRLSYDLKYLAVLDDPRRRREAAEWIVKYAAGVDAKEAKVAVQRARTILDKEN